MTSPDESQAFKKGKKFHHFIRLRVKYLAIFTEHGTVNIIDEDGNNYGVWQSIDAFRKYHNTHFKRDMVMDTYDKIELVR